MSISQTAACFGLDRLSSGYQYSVKKNKVKCNTRGESSRIKLYVVKTRVLHFTLFF